jgi:uroporphyrinogen-III decarboxylase
MTNRERIINTALCKDTDRAPFILYFGPWDETYKKWEIEGGFVPGTNIEEQLGYDNGFRVINDVNLGLCPAFSQEIIEEKKDTVISRNSFGVIIESLKTGETIPRCLEFPVKDMKDWELLKSERLNPASPARFPDNWEEVCRKYNEGDLVTQLGAYPYGLFGTARELMGVENLLVSFYDQPELIKDIMDYLTDFWITIYEMVCRGVRVDCIHIWEDMSGKQGSLISPCMIREFMLPNYKKIENFAHQHDIPFIMLDTDGNCDELIPLFMEVGINLLIPFEFAAGSDVVKYRKQYPDLGILGGIDKREIAKGKECIDKEIDRIEPLLKKNGYFPALDHLIHPEISWKDFSYYSRRLWEMIEDHRRDK